jgi:hypothetical protein
MPKFSPYPLIFGGSVANADASGPQQAEEQPLLATVPQTCQALNCSRTTVFDLLNSGILQRRKIGRATRVTVDSIKKLAGQL